MNPTMTPESLAAEERCYIRLATWAKARGFARIPPELVLAIAQLSEDAFRAGELSARTSGVRFRTADEEITSVHTTKFLRG